MLLGCCDSTANLTNWQHPVTNSMFDNCLLNLNAGSTPIQQVFITKINKFQ